MESATMQEIKSHAAEMGITPESVTGDRRLKTTWLAAIEAVQSAKLEVVAIAEEAVVIASEESIPEKAIVVAMEGVSLATEVVAVLTSPTAKQFYRNALILIVAIVVTLYWAIKSAVKWCDTQRPVVALQICTVALIALVQLRSIREWGSGEAAAIVGRLREVSGVAVGDGGDL